MAESDSLKWRGRLIRYAPILLWLMLIFYLSSSSGSMNETSRFVGPFLEFLIPGASAETIQAIHGYVRKAAHLTEYAILGILSYRVFLGRTIFKRGVIWPLLALGFVIAVASVDELNQSFNMDRTGSIFDVLIDTVGGSIAIFLVFMLKRRENIRAHSSH